MLLSIVPSNMSKEQLIELIKRDYPSLIRKDYVFIDTGWDNQIIILDNKIVFRFPRNEYVKWVLRKEKELLVLLWNYVTLSIPQYIYISSTYEYVGYEIVKWNLFTVEEYNNLSSETQKNIQAQLGVFLSQLHSVPLVELAAIWYKRGEDSDMSWWISELQTNFANACGQYFSADEIAQVNQYIFDLANFDYPHKTLTHGDIQGKNIILDPLKHVLSGVIDFSDARIADPALDFDLLWEYGDDFVQGVFDSYTGNKEDGFLWRSLFYAKRRHIFGLIDAVEKQKNVDLHLQSFKKTFLFL